MQELVLFGSHLLTPRCRRVLFLNAPFNATTRKNIFGLVSKTISLPHAASRKAELRVEELIITFVVSAATTESKAKGRLQHHRYLSFCARGGLYITD